MVVGVRGFTYGGDTTTGTTGVSVTGPTGIQSGDLVLIYCANGSTGASWSCTGFSSFTPKVNTSGNASAQLLYKFAGASEPSVYTISQTASHAMAVAIGAFSGVKVSPNQFDPAPADSSNANAASTTISTNSVTTTTDGDTLAAFFFDCFGSGGTPNPIPTSGAGSPTGYTVHGSQYNTSGPSSTNVGILAFTATQATHGSTGTSVTQSTSHSNGAMLIALAAAPASAGWGWDATNFGHAGWG